MPLRLAVRDLRSIWGAPLLLELGELVTVLVGPNRVGTSNLAWAVALTLDPDRPFRPARDLPRGRPHAEPSVEVVAADGRRGTVRFDRDRGTREVTGTPPSGHVVYSRIEETPRDLLRAAARAGSLELSSTEERRLLEARLVATARRVLAEVEQATVDDDGAVRLQDDLGAELPVPLCRATVALGTAVYLAERGTPPVAVVVEALDAFLHPAAQEAVVALLLDVAATSGAPVVVTTTSPFAIPRTGAARVVALGREDGTRTVVVGAASGDAAQARLLGGLLRDAGLAAVLDRLGAIPTGTRAVLFVEGGTDEAYLRQAARTLAREDVLEGVEIRPSGGAMGAVLGAVVLRAEVSLRVLVLLDHDDPGRRARDTLVSRFGFDRGTEVLTYADVFDGHPLGVEAETLFDVDLLRRFVREQGRSASVGEHVTHGLPHVDLSPSGKSALVGWLDAHVGPQHLRRWDALLDVLEELLGGTGRPG